MAINVRDIQSSSPQVSVEGEIEFVPSEIEDETNAMIVGPAERGPLFVPTEVRTREQFETIFGEPTTYSSFSAAEVLDQTDRVNFLRVIATDGWDPDPLVIFGAGGTEFPHFESGTGNPLAILIFDDEYQRVEGAVPEKTQLLKSTATTEKTAGDFTMRTFDEADNLVDEWRLSLDPFSGRYIERVLPPEVRIYQNFRETQREAVSDVEGDVFVNLRVFTDDSPLNFETFDAPRTPWIVSQENPPGQRHRLFRVWVRSDGEEQNRRFKLSIVDIGAGESESGWPTFTVRLRDFDDTDLNQQIIEEFPDVTLNPDDERYIGKVIGTEFEQYNQDTRRVEQFGIFDQQSLNIRVELSDEIGRSTAETLPFGFESYKQTFTESSQVPVYRTEQEFPGRLLDYLNANQPDSERGETISQNLHLGIEFRVQQNENFFQGIPEGAEDVDDGFKLDNYIDPKESTVDERKFTLGFQGGSGGQSIYRERFSGSDIQPSNTFGFDFDGKFSGGQDAYRRAFELLRDRQGGYSFDLLTTPELDFRNHERVIRNAEELVRDRGDAFYVFDGFEFSETPEDASTSFFNLDTTYAATYYGWVDPVDDIGFDFVPPSSVIPQTYARNDGIADPWFAPAGPNRGEIPGVEDVRVRLSRTDLDELYDNSVNAIRFANPSGIVLAGNLCFTTNLDSLLSAIDVRRTLVFLISRISEVASEYLFEQISDETAQNMRIDFNDVLSSVQARSGIREYQVEISTPQSRGDEDREPNTITSSISLIPQPSSEYITVQFVIQEEGINVIT